MTDHGPAAEERQHTLLRLVYKTPVLVQLDRQAQLGIARMHAAQ